MAAASARTGTPAGLAWRSRARRSSLKVTRPTIATATDPPNTAVSAPVRLPATVPVPAELRRAAAFDDACSLQGRVFCHASSLTSGRLAASLASSDFESAALNPPHTPSFRNAGDGGFGA